jgi:deoxyribonuclease-4
LQVTRQHIDRVVKGTLVFDTTVAYEHVEGHPDAQTETQLFEVKLTGQLKKNWLQFLQQVFAYGALEPKATEVFLVLPLQQTVWSFDLSKWPALSRTKFRDLLETTSKNRQVVSAGTAGAGETSTEPAQDRQALQQFYNIGAHVHKEKSLVTTIQGLSALTCPVQIFLSGPISSKLTIRDEELAKSAEAMSKTNLRMFVHAPYIINLSADKDEANNFGVELLKKNLQYANVVGCKGVVVHVGKSVKKTKEQAIANMRRNLEEAMASATPQCPILLETPAGQGTELLTTYDEFVNFVNEINDPKLRICVDTCHVFATGQQPLEYLRRLTTEHPALLTLVHYNDSATPCGSCLDRHAAFGTGHIGLDTMLQIANHCRTHSIPMVIE